LSRSRRAWATIADRFTGVPSAEPALAPTVAAASPADAPVTPFAGRLAAEVCRRPVRVIAACLASVLGPAVVAHAGSAKMPSVAGSPSSEHAIASNAPLLTPGPGDLPAWRAVAQMAADTCPGLPAPILVAIGQAESSLGRRTFPSSAGAVGPMQFLPGTWQAYGTDGNGDGRADVMDTADALHGAARMLCAHGGADAARLPSALWDYNHSDDYVARVLALARASSATP